MFNVAVPDYVILNYDFIIWTSFTDQMNTIVEKINWSEGSYWGEPGKFKFKVNIDSFENTTEMADNERIIKTNFTFNFCTSVLNHLRKIYYYKKKAQYICWAFFNFTYFWITLNQLLYNIS